MRVFLLKIRQQDSTTAPLLAYWSYLILSLNIVYSKKKKKHHDATRAPLTAYLLHPVVITVQNPFKCEHRLLKKKETTRCDSDATCLQNYYLLLNVNIFCLKKKRQWGGTGTQLCCVLVASCCHQC